MKIKKQTPITKYYNYELKSTMVEECPLPKFQQTEQVADMIRKLCFDDGTMDIYESVYLILLNRNLKLKGVAKIGQGGVSGCVADIRIICKFAVDSLASGCILAHNHPSGNTSPSDNDKMLTTKAKNALQFLDVNLYDHFIITNDSYYSFAENGHL
jgi:DNA repair protein RadC